MNFKVDEGTLTYSRRNDQRRWVCKRRGKILQRWIRLIGQDCVLPDRPLPPLEQSVQR